MSKYVIASSFVY